MCTQAEIHGLCSGDRWCCFKKSEAPVVPVTYPRSKFRDFILFQEINNNYICFLFAICFQQDRKNLFVITICDC